MVVRDINFKHLHYFWAVAKAGRRFPIWSECR